ncbi:MAG: aromatic ring-hydroxylating dioxygenase subunit alpha [Cellvibrionales bacterium]|nr:aromatic ring-hydroxylating dioxygenase subunit alpha [Cellvibrionales bacterium]
MTNLLTQYIESAKQPLEQAECLPFAVYHDPDTYKKEVHDIFFNDWVFCTAEANLKAIGSYYAFTLAGESIAIVRNQENQLVALSNVCRHRGTLLLDEGYGHFKKHIVCPYHAWAYNDEGKLLAAPFSGNVAIDKKAHCLPTYSVDTFLGLVFVHIKPPKMTLEERFGKVAELTKDYEPDRFTQAYYSDDEVWHANWKLAVENGIESYHLFKVHKDTLEQTTPTKTAYYVEGSEKWAVTGGKIKGAAPVSSWFKRSYPEHLDHYRLVFLPPGFIGIMTYESFDWIQVMPKSSTSCLIKSGGISTSNKLSQSQKDFTKAFFAEDKWICERVQQGMQSQLTKGGKLVGMEKIVVDFHQYLANQLNSTNQ